MVVGASGVLGGAIVRNFVSRGLEVVVAGRNVKTLHALRLSIPRQSQDRVHAIPVDVTDSLGVKDFFDRIDSEIGVPRRLVMAAGIYGAIGAVGEVNPNSWRRAIEVNLFGVYNCCHCLIPRLIQAGRGGSIINIAGGGSSGPLEYLSSYAISKVAVARLSDSLSREVSSYGITVNAVLPGPVDSPMQDELLDAGLRAGHWHRQFLSMRENNEGWASPERTAELVAFLLFGHGRHLTGKLLSARYDHFDQWTEDQVKNIATSELYTLRRVDPATIERVLNGGVI